MILPVTRGEFYNHPINITGFLAELCCRIYLKEYALVLDLSGTILNKFLVEEMLVMGTPLIRVYTNALVMLLNYILLTHK